MRDQAALRIGSSVQQHPSSLHLLRHSCCRACRRGRRLITRTPAPRRSRNALQTCRHLSRRNHNSCRLNAWRGGDGRAECHAGSSLLCPRTADLTRQKTLSVVRPTPICNCLLQRWVPLCLDGGGFWRATKA